MEGTLDSFDFVLAEALGKTLPEIRSWPNAEITEWKAFYVYRTAMQNMEDPDGGD